MKVENSETSKSHNNNLLREQQMSIVLNSSSICSPIGIFWKILLSYGKKVNTGPYIIRNSISEHPYENQAGYVFKYQKEDSAGLLKIFQNKKEKISASVHVREAETKISVI